MKRLLLIPLLLLTGCMTSNQLAAEKSYYESVVALQAQKSSQPIFELTPAKEGEPITLGNVGSFRVFAPPTNSGQNLQQYVQKDYVQPWLNVLSMGVPWLGAWGIVSSTASAMKEMGNYNSINITGKGNTGSIAPTHNVVSGTGNYGAGTSTPTIVEQPPPTIVNPVIVEQPAPIIVRP